MNDAEVVKALGALAQESRLRLFRYLYLLYRQGGGGDPSNDLFRDPHLIVAMLGWLTVTVSILR